MPDPIDADALAEAANSPAAASVDGRSASAHPLGEVAKILDRQEARDALEGSNANGGPVSGGSKLRMAKYRPQGGPQ